MGKNKEPVLESDKTLRFPHALLISAGAGSGKTYALTQRYVQLLLSERVPDNDLSSILAVTFTNNAAKEMKARILGWLKDLALARDEEKIKETMALVSLSRAEIIKRAGALVDRVIDNYSDFHIQTIDSFLARVMAASADELKLPLKAEITMAYDVLIDLALYSMFSRIGKDLPEAEIDKFLAVLPKSGAYPWNPVTRVKEHFDSFLNQEGKTAGLIARASGDYETALPDKFKTVLRETRNLVGRFGPSLVKDSAAAAMRAENITDFLAAYSFKFAVFNGIKKKNFPDGWEKDVARLSDLVIELTELNAAAYYHPYVGLYDRFKAELERVKRGKTDVIHINDIAKRLASYINADNVPEVYLKLGERISHFLIDEFQDTNRLQWDVIRPLVEEGLSKTGSLFVVGDIKQAIYMFRNADYRIMRDFLDKAEGKKAARSARGTDCGQSRPDPAELKHLSLASLGGELKYADLPVNYRSDGRVLEYVDSLFKDKLKNSPELVGEDITELTAYKQSVRPDRVKDGYVRTDILELDDPGDPAEQKKWLLAAVEGARKRYPLGEIAILVAKNKRIEPVVEWLTEAGVPVASLSSLDIRKRKVVAELLSWLRFLETPSDDLAFADFITGDIFTRLTGLSRDEMRDFIFKARQEDRDALLYAAFRNHPRYAKYWNECLDGGFRKVGHLPLYELVSLVYGDLRVFGNFPGEQAFLARLLDAVTALEAEGVTSPRAFLEYAAGGDEDKAKVFAIALPEYIDAVRVMTFHKSKGLGFSVVINLVYDERGQADPMYFEERDGAIHVYHITKAAAEQSVKLRPVYAGRKKDSNVQDLNVLYVISTRARHELYNLVVKKTRKTEAGEPRLTDLFTACELGKPADRSPAARKPSAPVEIAAPGPRPDQRFDASKPTYTSFFETAEGELVHAILARCIELPKDPEGEISAAFDELAPAYPFKFDKSKVVKSLVAFLASPEAAPLFESRPGRQVLIEAEFIDKTGSLFRMDRVLIDADTVTVIDFKTGLENTAKYTPQMKNYLAILSEAYSKPAKGFLAYVDLIIIGRA
ncbi:MAG: UvrD/REP helicase [Elusimicrobia bacterium]|nr:MAG: UvrD/REP helicase [Elusimicrobiota bacterium]KAF0154798.1 MAG: UvrD/REP helicase [Elusimicrobiota bacterium]